jgi:hypothetical protein
VRRTGSAVATVKEFREHGLKFPRRIAHGPNKGDVVWNELQHSRALWILHHPRYAGAFCFGRTHTRLHPDGHQTLVKVAPDEWTALIRDAVRSKNQNGRDHDHLSAGRIAVLQTFGHILGRSMAPPFTDGRGEGTVMDWTHILAYVTGTVDQELLARNEYLAAENRILKSQLNGALRLSHAERARLGKIGHRLGRQALAEVATVARPDTILAWYRKLIAGKFDGSKARRGAGRPRVTRQVEQLIVRMASENCDWGYDRIVGALANLGYVISDQTGWQYLAPPRAAAGARAQAYDHMAGLHSDPLGAAGSD